MLAAFAMGYICGVIWILLGIAIREILWKRNGN